MNAVGKKLDEVLGKGLADKIMAKESGTLSGEGLKFGGEWANNLYDKQVGNIVKELTGAKIETLDMGLPIDAKNNSIFRFVEISPRTGRLTSGLKIEPKDLKIGLEITPGATNEVVGGYEGNYIITDILGDGKFKAVPKEKYEMVIRDKAEIPGTYKQTFDISQKTTTQQGIKLTPEIKAKIRGEALEIKTSGKQFE
jgi:hypothetical protein